MENEIKNGHDKIRIEDILMPPSLFIGQSDKAKEMDDIESIIEEVDDNISRLKMIRRKYVKQYNEIKDSYNSKDNMKRHFYGKNVYDPNSVLRTYEGRSWAKLFIHGVIQVRKMTFEETVITFLMSLLKEHSIPVLSIRIYKRDRRDSYWLASTTNLINGKHSYKKLLTLKRYRYYIANVILSSYGTLKTLGKLYFDKFANNLKRYKCR